jgi:hypothetical protein
MIVDQLEARARGRLPLDAGPGDRVRVSAQRGDDEIAVVYRVGPGGRLLLNHFFCGVRIERQALLMLLCDESACPQAEQVRQRWRAFRSGAEPRPCPRAKPVSGRTRALIEEVPITESGHHCTARPATFECLTVCPTGAHPPVRLRKPGWDLFEDGVWLSGSVIVNHRTGESAPRFSTLIAARRWLTRQRAVTDDVLHSLK